MEAMENEFIFTAMFAVVWVVLAVASLFTAILYRHKVRNGGTKAINNLRVTLDCLSFLWFLYGVATFVSFVIELLIQAK